MDRVRISCNGGVSALSAFFTGFGSSIALDMPLDIVMSRTGKKQLKKNGAISKTLELLEERFSIRESYRVSVTKAIPRGKGLKSSSALTLSIISGFLELNGINMKDSDLLGMAAEMSIRNGTSSTGAYDDLCSSFYGGFCLTDNTHRRLIFRKEVPESPVLIVYNKSKRASSAVKLDEMRKFAKHGQMIMGLVEEGKYGEAMTLNGNLLGYVYGQNDRLVKSLLSSGALYSGQCGKGPAIFAVFETREEMARAAKDMEDAFKVHYRKTSFSNRGIVKEAL